MHLKFAFLSTTMLICSTARAETGMAATITADAVPDAYKRQLAAYVALLRGVFPDCTVGAALLYTAGPKLIALSDAHLAPHKPRLPA